MILCAYIGDGGYIEWVNDEGTSTFSQVFVRRPSGCRYAIVKMKSTYASIDMFEGLMLPYPVSAFLHDKRAEVGVHYHYPTLNTAILATILSYDTGETLDGKTQEEINTFVHTAQNCPDCQWGN